MKSDFLHSNNHFHDLSSKVNDKDLQNFVSSVTYFNLKNPNNKIVKKIKM